MVILNRCFGNKPTQDLYAHYHDHEWGIPVHDDRTLCEMLILEGMQAGLSWETVLKRRPAYRELFAHFQPHIVADMSDTDLEALTQNPRIIRNKLKIKAIRTNARVFVMIQKEFGSFDAYLWRFVGQQPLKNFWKSPKDIPTTSPESIALSQDLQKRGMTFVGPTIMYAFMQAVGMVDDHIASCWKRTDVA